MRLDKQRKSVFTRRIMLLGTLKIGLVSLIMSRLFRLQILEHRKFIKQSDNNRLSFQLLTPRRGNVFDRLGRAITMNRKTFQVVITKEHAPNPKETLLKLRKFIALSDQEMEDILEKIRVRRAFIPVVVKSNLIRKEAFDIEENSFLLPGVSIEEVEQRYYIFSGVGAHIVGYVGRVNSKELEKDPDPLLKMPKFQIGKTGLERSYDKVLRGRSGKKYVEVNARGRVIRDIETIDQIDGTSIVLTLDWELQEYITKRIEGFSAGVMAMNIHTGEIVGSVSSPSFNPNTFARGISQSEWQQLLNNPRAPIMNKVFRGTWSPGSTFKTVVALAALEEGIIRPEETVFCKGYIELGPSKHKKYCWSRSGHGKVNMMQSFEQSCDVYYYEISKKVGINTIEKYARMLGFGENLLEGFAGVSSGILPSRKWLKKRHNMTWMVGDTLNVSIGQGYLLSTPLQNAVSFARICNGGYKVMPTLTRDLLLPYHAAEKKPIIRAEKLPFDQQNLDVIMRGLYDVMHGSKGTARKYNLGDSDWQMIGKTGTVQVRRITEAERKQGITKNEDRVWKYRDHANFVGVAPFNNPRWVVSVYIEHAGSGSADAAPVARDVILKIKEREAIWERIPYFTK